MPGWQRFQAADDWLKRNATARVQAQNSSELKQQFNAFLASQPTASASGTIDNAALFEEFLKWRESRR